MSWFDNFIENGAPPVSPPIYTGTTTAELVRDRAIALIKALIPTKYPKVGFKPYLNELGADFQSAMEAHAEGSYRQYQVRDDGIRGSYTVSNTDVVEDSVTLIILIAYPQTNFAGPNNALDRDDVMSKDSFQVDQVVGMNGYTNFAGPPPIPNATWTPDKYRVSRIRGAGVDFLEIIQSYRFYRSVP